MADNDPQEGPSQTPSWATNSDPARKLTLTSVTPALDTQESTAQRSPITTAVPATQNSEESESMQLGREVGNWLKANDIHPIVLFGSKGSGKTTVLASLIKFMRVSGAAGGTVYFLNELFPVSPGWNKLRASAEEIFFTKVQRIIDGTAPGATNEVQPFFIPIQLNILGREVRFAFLEGNGEWYMPDETKTRPYKEFPPLLRAALEAYSENISTIFVAPSTETTYKRNVEAGHGRSEAQYARDSDIGLVGALVAYREARPASHQNDTYLLLLTKWDVCCPDGILSDNFCDPPENMVEYLIHERFPQVWHEYCNLTIQRTERGKSVTAYCAGLINPDLSIAKCTEEQAERIDYFAKKLWNWCHFNATGENLYDDVLPARKSFLDRLTDWLRGRRK